MGQITKEEMELVLNPQVLLLKNGIIKRVYQLFGNLSEQYKKEINTELLIDENVREAKISRGENYEGLPYVMLDFPRQFGKADVFAVRSFFWWGNFFSITLHLEGVYQQKFSYAIETALAEKELDDWYIATSDNRWEHHFDEDNYSAITDLGNLKIITLPFLKLSKKIPLIKWNEAEIFFCENFIFIMIMLARQAPIL